MTEWNNGYVSEIGYTYGYYNELSPSRTNFTLLYAGYAAVSNNGYHCELGFGQGISINILSAVTNHTWFGNDFNPAQVANAQKIGNASNSKIHLTDESFQEYAQRDDLPKFDSIRLHGIWSWISESNRNHIINFIKKNLNVGGVLYISYNAMPGWTTFLPIRKMLSLHNEVLGNSNQGIIKNIEKAIDYVVELNNIEPKYFKNNPDSVQRLLKIKNQDKNYLAHEYFNSDWRPFYFSEVHESLKECKLDYICSANMLDQLKVINFTESQLKLIEPIDDIVLRENTKDIVLNQQFRKDYWIKGPLKLTESERIIEARKVKVILVTPSEEINLKVIGAVGEAELNSEVYKPIISLLSNYSIYSVEGIEKELAKNKISFESLFQALYVLIAKGSVALVQDENSIDKAKESSQRLNNYIIQQSQLSNKIQYLVSPVIAEGVSIGRFAQLFIFSYKNGCSKTEQWADFAWSILLGENQRIVVDGKPLETPEENLIELNKQAKYFKEKRFEILEKLMII